MKSLNAIQIEFELKYEGTVMLATEVSTGRKGLCYVSTDGEEGWPYISLTSKCRIHGHALGGSVSIYDLLLERWLPEEGYYNSTQLGAFYLVRSSVKQWKNSFTSSIYHAYAGTGAGCEQLNVENKSVVGGIHYSNYLPLNQAAALAEKKNKSVAVSNRLCVSPSKETDCLLLYHDGYPVGTVAQHKGDEFTVLPYSLPTRNLLQHFNLPLLSGEAA